HIAVPVLPAACAPLLVFLSAVCVLVPEPQQVQRQDLGKVQQPVPLMQVPMLEECPFLPLALDPETQSYILWPNRMPQQPSPQEKNASYLTLLFLLIH